MAQIQWYTNIAGSPAAALGLVTDDSNDQIINQAVTGTAANNNIPDDAKYIKIVETEGKDIAVRIGDGVTATATDLFIPAYGSEAFVLPSPRNDTWRVSLINA